MPHCCAWNCTNQYSNNTDISYHKLPIDKKIAQVWIKNINRTELPKQVYLCSQHFEESCFDVSHDLKQRLLPSASNRKSRKLVKGAVPSLFAHKPVKSRKSSEKRLEIKQKHEVHFHIARYY